MLIWLLILSLENILFESFAFIKLSELIITESDWESME